jgi:hypothetical protein
MKPKSQTTRQNHKTKLKDVNDGSHYVWWQLGEKN